MKYYFLILFFYCWTVCFNLFAQKKATQPVENTPILSLHGTVGEKGMLDIKQYISFADNYEDSLKAMIVFSKGKFVTLDKIKELKILHKPCFLWLTIENTHLQDTLKLVLFTGQHLDINLYWQNGSKKNRILSGWRNEYQESVPVLVKVKDKFGIPLYILPNTQISYLIKLVDITSSVNVSALLFSESGYKTYQNNLFLNRKLSLCFSYMIIGVCLFLGIFSSFQFIYSKDKTYLWWAFYLLSNFTFFLLSFDYIFNIGFITAKFTILQSVSEYFNIAFYLLFAKYFLKLKIYAPYLAQIFNYLIAFIFCFLGGCFLARQLGFDVYPLSFKVVSILEFLLIIVFICLLIAKIPEKSLLLIGSLGVLLSAIYAGYMDESGATDLNYLLKTPEIIYGFGTMFELLFFSLALTQRTKLIELKTQQLQKNYTAEIEQKLAERTLEIQEQNTLLENQKIQQLSSEFEHKLAETEMTALRAQMNPHFIFNCLNSIKLYTLENDSQMASEFLTKFSRLIRLVLENSRSEKVTLENELETLRLYIELEAMRFKDKVNYKINVESTIDQQYTEIPPLLLQPYVENAIWHGLMQKNEGGMVTIDVSQPKEQILHVEISDNGIGREQSALYKSKSATKQKSFGLKMTSDRINIINQLYQTTTEVHIIDLKDKQGNAIGTKVIVEIPL